VVTLRVPPDASRLWPEPLPDGAGVWASGRKSVKVLPSPGALATRISPPRSRAISRLIDSPSPVPPYLRLVVPSACWNASKMMRCLSGAMPMPVSVTEKATTLSARLSDS
jgi:hypothetical protein